MTAAVVRTTRAAAVFSAAIATSGCTATVALAPASAAARQANTTDTVDGEPLPAIEGRILGSDERHIVVERCHDGRQLTVPREDVVDIDHPGNVLALLGLGSTLAGAIVFPLSLMRSTECVHQRGRDCSHDEEELNTAGGVGLGLLAVGAVTTLTGLVIWKVSKAAADD